MKKFRFFTGMLGAMLSLLTVCGCSDDTQVIIVASQRTYYCMDDCLHPMFLMKKPNATQWTFCDIWEFDWEEGYEYTLEVKQVHTPELQDASEWHYEVESIVNKVKTDSKNLPDRLYDETWPKLMPCSQLDSLLEASGREQ